MTDEVFQPEPTPRSWSLSPASQALVEYAAQARQRAEERFQSAILLAARADGVPNGVAINLQDGKWVSAGTTNPE